jgi:FSR family fosmidomycin resistance protein-like MFS transporter
MAKVPASRFDVLKNRPLMILSSGHFTIDMYAGLLPVLYPLLTTRFDLNLQSVALVSLAYGGVSSVSQPLFGYIADKFGTRFTGLAMAWTALLFATIGFAPTFETLLILASLAGLGSGAFHPFGALNANVVIPEGQKNTAMSVYVTGGTLGVALGPIVGAVLFTVFGMRGTAVMMLPGLSIAIWMLLAMRDVSFTGSRYQDAASRARGAPPLPMTVITIVILVMMLRMVPTIGVQNFIPVWYERLGYGAGFYGPLATTVVLGSAVGALGAGSLADRYGRRTVILVTLWLTIPAIFLFAEFPGPPAFATGAVVGLLAASTGPLLLVMAQQLMVGRAGMASGLILGLSFIAAALSAPLFGALADAIGLQNAMRSLPVLVFATIGVAWFLPDENQVRQLSAIPEARDITSNGERTDAAHDVA